jgi:hypothetical protein
MLIGTFVRPGNRDSGWPLTLEVWLATMQTRRYYSKKIKMAITK